MVDTWWIFKGHYSYINSQFNGSYPLCGKESIAFYSEMVLTSEKQREIPTTGYFCDSLTQAVAQLESGHVCTVAKSQLASVILSAHKRLSILCPTQNTPQVRHLEFIAKN